METIIISGPTGSGKTTLSKQILSKVNNGIILNTDMYYKTGIKSKILSKLIKGYFDRKISFNYQLFKEDLLFILKNCKFNHKYTYDFKNKTVKKSFIKKSKIDYLIIEGIFSKELLGVIKKYRFFLIEIKIKKKSCMSRVIKRDVNERGKSENLAKQEFLKSWDLYYLRNRKKYFKYNINQLIYTENNDLNFLLEKLSI